MKLQQNSLRHNILLALASLSLASPAVFTPPAAASPKFDARGHQPCPDRTLADVQADEAQKQVFGSHDGHVMLPTPQDLANYQDAAAKAEALRPLIPCHPRRDDHKRHKR